MPEKEAVREISHRTRAAMQQKQIELGMSPA
jgi:hypothetical protein